MSGFETVEATFDNSVLQLHRPLSLDKQQRVLVIVLPVSESLVSPSKTPTPDEILSLAAQVYAGLAQTEIDEIEDIALNRSRFFDKST